jgi:heat-inducible transcriptional repressor
MAFENLTEREKQVLGNLISYYIQSADPVGSRVIANKFKMGISSATIRNTLQDLEELGLVEQPHTSAGRIPTDLGYRVYVDYLLKPEELTEEEKQVIRATLLREGRGIDEILGQTSHILGDITNQLGVTIAPQFDRGQLSSLRLIPVAEDRVMVVVVVQSGLAKSVILEVKTQVDHQALQDVEGVLNERLAGLTLGEIRQTVDQRLAGVQDKGRLLNLIIDSTEKIWTDGRKTDIRLAGADHLLNQPEFSDRERISGLVRLLEDGRILSEFLRQAEKEGLIITIGRENKFSEIFDCSLVTSSYRVGDISGTIGVIGPTRMAYSKLSSVVEYTARTITDVLSGIDHKKEDESS